MHNNKRENFENSFDNSQVLIKMFCSTGDVPRHFSWFGVSSEDLVSRVPVKLEYSSTQQSMFPFLAQPTWE